MDPLLLDPPPAYGALVLVGKPGRDEPGRDTALQQDMGLGDICVYFQPTGTLVRLFGRVDQSMRKELVEAAFDVVGRGGPVTIDIAPDAQVDPGLLCFLHRISGHESPYATPGGLSAADRLRSPHEQPRPPASKGSGTGRRVPAAR